MAIIDPDELYRSVALQKCSDAARLLYPYLFLAANGFGRIELNYPFLLGRCFVQFEHPPAAELFWQTIAEYRAADLLFLYSSAGQLWGQWWVLPHHLPGYKTWRDKRSPIPPEPAYTEWVQSVSEANKDVPCFPEFFQNIPKTFQEVSQNISLDRREGKGREGSCDDLANILKISPERENGTGGDIPNSLSLEVPKTSNPNGAKPELQAPQNSTNGFPEFWAPYPRKGHHRPKAEAAWRDLVPNGKKPKALACLTRYLASQEVADGVILNPENFIRENALTNWDAEWPAAKNKKPTDAEVLKIMEDRKHI